MAASNHRVLEINLDLDPKTYDIDFSGIVSNIVYIRWLEDLRLAWLREHFLPLHALLDRGVAPVLLQTRIDYKRALTISDEPSGRLWVSNCTPIKWTLGAEIAVRSRIAAVAEQTGGFLNLSTKQAIPLPDVLYNKMEAALQGIAAPSLLPTPAG